MLRIVFSRPQKYTNFFKSFENQDPAQMLEVFRPWRYFVYIFSVFEQHVSCKFSLAQSRPVVLEINIFVLEIAAL